MAAVATLHVAKSQGGGPAGPAGYWGLWADIPHRGLSFFVSFVGNLVGASVLGCSGSVPFYLAKRIIVVGRLAGRA